MTEAQCLESAGIVIEEEHVPIMQVRPKNQRPISATHKNYEAQKEVSKRDFLKNDHYFDYHEAKRLLDGKS